MGNNLKGFPIAPHKERRDGLGSPVSPFPGGKGSITRKQALGKAVGMSSSAVLRVRAREFEDAFIETAQDERAEVDGKDAVSDVFECDILTGEDMRDVEETIVPANSAVSADAAELEVSRVLKNG